MEIKNRHIAVAVLFFCMVFSVFHKTSIALAGDVTIASSYGQTDNGSVEQPLAPEKNPSGDIPDSQIFVKYISNQGGFELDVPEGWARTTKGGKIIFISKLDGLSVRIAEMKKMPDVQSVRNNQAKQLKNTGRAVIIKGINSAKLKGGAAVCVVYESNSEPNSVTNRQVRLENEAYFFYRDGRIAELRLWAPVGADNVDQWVRISNSFKWR